LGVIRKSPEIKERESGAEWIADCVNRIWEWPDQGGAMMENMSRRAISPVCMENIAR
jgi:hypothetical protein